MVVRGVRPFCVNLPTRWSSRKADKSCPSLRICLSRLWHPTLLRSLQIKFAWDRRGVFKINNLIFCTHKRRWCCFLRRFYNKNRASLVAQTVKILPVMQETWVWALGREDPLEKEMGRVETHSSILAWRIPWTEEPGGLHSMGLQRVGHNWVTNTFTTIRICWNVFIMRIQVSFLPQIYQCSLKTSFGPCRFSSVFILIPSQWESKAFHLRGDDFSSCQMFLMEDSGVFTVFVYFECLWGILFFLSLCSLAVSSCDGHYCLLVFFMYHIN